MTIAIWIIAIVETIRMFCQYKQLKLIESDTGSRDRAYEEFIKSLKVTDEEFAKRMIEEWQKQFEVEDE